MSLQRFYVAGIHNKWGPLELNHKIWINDEVLLQQWLNELHLKLGDRVVLFNDETERIYKIIMIEPPNSVQLELVTEEVVKTPATHVYLLWPLLEQEKNDRVLQKATTLGVHNFVPILADNGEKAGFNFEHARKIVIEAAEQCNRADIPEIREEPIDTEVAISEYASLPLLVCGQTKAVSELSCLEKVGILLAPEGDWSPREMEMFKKNNLSFVSVANLRLPTQIEAVSAVIGQVGKEA